MTVATTAASLHADAVPTGQRHADIRDWPDPTAGWIIAWLLLALAIHAVFFHSVLSTDEGGDAFVARHWASTAGSLYGGYWLDRPPLLVALYSLADPWGAAGLRVLASLAAVVATLGTIGIAGLVGGRRAAFWACPLAALALSSGVLGSVFAVGELLAVVPGTLSLLCLLASRDAGRRRELLLLGAAGVLAASSVLVKQSFVDALGAGGVFLLVSTVDGARPRPAVRRAVERVGAWGIGVALPLVAVLGWAASTAPGLLGFRYAMWGFRVDAVRALAHASKPISQRAEGLALAAAGSGVLLLVLLAIVGLVQLTPRRVVAATLAAWLALGMFGVVGGGYYWPHYLIQVVPPCAVLCACLFARGRGRFATVLVLALTIVTVGAVPTALRVHESSRSRTVDVADYVHDRARPTDSLYVMYARANLVWYAGMRAPFPYLWSSMFRAKPDAQRRLRSWLGSAARPTWVVL